MTAAGLPNNTRKNIMTKHIKENKNITGAKVETLTDADVETIGSGDDGAGRIDVIGARVNNLANINVSIPRNSLTVITGLSGSGKSSLAFETIFAEGQRRYIETFSSYARNLLGSMQRPDVDKITGLSPVIAIEQKTINRNPRSTIGTTTEIYDFLRLLFARVATPKSYLTGKAMVKYTREKIVSLILDKYEGHRIYVFAPLIHNRKGHYKELFETLRKKGYLNVRVDGEIRELEPNMRLERYKNHSIELLIDKLKVSAADENRVRATIENALVQGDRQMLIYDADTDTTAHLSQSLLDPETGLSYREPAPHNFSFNSPLGACPKCAGLGYVNVIDRAKVLPDPALSIAAGGIAPLGKYKNSMIFWQIEAICQKYGCSLQTPVGELPEQCINDILNGTTERLSIKNETMSTHNYFATYEGVIKYLEMQQDDEAGASARKWAEQFHTRTVCPECKGDRLNREALHFFIGDKNIADLTRMDISELRDWISNASSLVDPQLRPVANEIFKEINHRLGFLCDVGLDYLQLNRASASLSGGESQRIRLATQIGSELVNVLYILDEPSIGLHQKDNLRLINSLRKLTDAGNTVIVVEHDRDIMLAADYIVDIGPGAGSDGGKVVFQGTPAEMLASDTLTANYLNGKLSLAPTTPPLPGNGKSLILRCASGHNLRDVDLTVPLGTLTCVAGVSGSGKSSLITGTLVPALSQHFYNSLTPPLPFKSIEGIENIDKIITVDQSPLGKSPRSNPATYTGLFNDIRALFVALPEAKIRGYKPGRFSFNAPAGGGRCEACGGNGYKTIQMNFLPDVLVPCTLCQGRRYNRETLEVRYRGKSIADVLAMTVDEALIFFHGIPALRNKLQVLHDLGLGYITLGQPSSTLSGGENQRVKLAAQLSRRDTGNTLFVLDEPTTGLHFDDIKTLIAALRRIVERGNTVLVIEHNTDLLQSADHIIDMGPGGGRDGGQIMAAGTPAEIAAGESPTAPYL